MMNLKFTISLSVSSRKLNSFTKQRFFTIIYISEIDLLKKKLNCNNIIFNAKTIIIETKNKQQYKHKYKIEQIRWKTNIG